MLLGKDLDGRQQIYISVCKKSTMTMLMMVMKKRRTDEGLRHSRVMKYWQLLD
jgi:hypothetical protein